mmetsp:Transcript_11525/g.24991  ORF Transcript_11525/g.24991 Transcript_11525/m.24991 type:complete len:220 (-) Transcript_11525:815-1474(-)
MRWVDLENCLAHTSHHASVGPAGRDCLGLHVPLHSWGHTVSALDERRGTAPGELVGHLDPRYFTGEGGLEEVADRLVVLVQLLLFLLSLLAVVAVEVETFLRYIDQLMFLVVRDALDHDLVERLGEVQHLVSSAADLLGRGTHLRLIPAVGCHIVDLLLSLLHILNVLVKARVLIGSLRREEPEERDDVILVTLVFDDAHLKVLPEIVPEHDVLGVVLV